MSVFLTDLAGRVAGRWLTGLAVPAVGFLAAVFAAVVLGHGHAFDVGLLVTRADALAASATPGGATVLAFALPAIAALVGSGVRAIGYAFETAWFGDRRWLALGLGDGLPDLASRLREQVNVDLATVWPALWLHLPETSRVELTTTRAVPTEAATRIGWGVLWLLLGMIWWPAALVGSALVTSGRIRARKGIEDYLRVVEAVVRSHGAELAQTLGLAASGPLTRSLGWRLTLHLRNNPKFELTERDRASAALRPD